MGPGPGGTPQETPGATGQTQLSELELWALCRIDLGLTDHEFFRLTLREIDFLAKRRARIRMLDVDYPQAYIRQLLANIYRDRDLHKKPFEAKEFLLWPDSEETPLPAKTLDERTIEKVRKLAFALGAEVNIP